jgi:hypothetical protein
MNAVSVDTYLSFCLKEGFVTRWPERLLPIKVYISPFNWYEKSKQQYAQAYNRMAWECFEEWTARTGQAVRFQQVKSLNESQINLVWRRVDRKSLGHCQTLWDAKGRIYGAEISIGVSDGLVHAQYNSPAEVKHTILHEIGHALGLNGHSDEPTDMMYVPHQYGVTVLSERDVNTVKWLYQLPIGLNVWQEAQALGLEALDVSGFLVRWFGLTGEGHSLVSDGGGLFNNLLQQVVQGGHQTTKRYDGFGDGVSSQPGIEEQQALLSQMGQFYLATSSLRTPQSVEGMVPPLIPPLMPPFKNRSV